jgi:hypothetical protein
MTAGALALVIVTTFGSTSATAQISQSDLSRDSEIVLLEQAESGAYQRYTITINIHEGKTVLATDKDGVKANFEVNSDEGLALWHHLLKSGLENLADASSSTALPDESAFTVNFRVGQTVGGFSAAGVDTLPDRRYRTIVRAILALGDKYSRTRGR